MPRFLAIAALATAAGCVQGWSIRGQVAQPISASGERAPASGAVVLLRCPAEPGQVPVERTAIADRNGSFDLSGAGEGPRGDCEIAVRKPGFALYLTTVDQTCTDGDAGERCQQAALLALLDPAP